MAPVNPDDDDIGQQQIIDFFFGSQTGTAEEVAWDMVRQGRRQGFNCRDPQAIDDAGVSGLCQARMVVFVVSTTGQGDPPSNMRRVWQELLLASLAKDFLSNLHFTVFGLGDSHYREFNYAARKLYSRLKSLGAMPFFRIGLGDEQHDFGFEQELDPWAGDMWAHLASRVVLRPESFNAEKNDSRYVVTELGTFSEDACVSLSGKGTEQESHFSAEVVSNQSLCLQEHAASHQDVRNIRLSLPPEITFEAGDVCVVWPHTQSEVVRTFVVETLGRDPRSLVLVRPRSSSSQKCIFPHTPLTLETIFSSYLDINSVPSRYFFSVLAQHTDHDLHRKKLTEFASRTLEAKDALYEYCKREKRSAAEVMWDFWTARPPLEELLSALPPMRPRMYSIASCPKWYDLDHSSQRVANFWACYAAAVGPAWRARFAGQAATRAISESIQQCASSSDPHKRVPESFDLCVAVVEFTTRTGRTGHGLCSTYLRDAPIGLHVQCAIEKGSLALPPLEVPLIFICPGTGLSPCRALAQQRHLQIGQLPESSRPVRFAHGVKDMMFLGFRHKKGDFLYGGEWSEFHDWLSVHVAFSRDCEDRKVYVQDVIEEHGSQVCTALDAGARIYICGRSHPMPSQVFNSLVEILQIHRGFSDEDATKYLRELQRTQRYICDTWG